MTLMFAKRAAHAVSGIFAMRPLTACAALLIIVTAAVHAQDRIVTRTASGSKIGISCRIVDYTGREAVYLTKAGGATKRLPRGEIVEVTTSYNEAHTAGRTLLAEGKAAEAFEKLETALDTEQRLWVRREILATQVKAALWTGDRIAAGQRFLAIVESDPATLYFPLMPLSWSDEPPSAQLARISRQWIAQTDSSAAVLLGGSHLLTDPAQSREAIKTLESIARDENPDLQRLAQIQIWRAKTLTDDLSRDELLRWERAMESAAETIGGNPRFFLGMAYKHRRDDVAAAAAWLWLPMVYSDDRHLAALSAWNAGQSLERAGQPDEAKAIYTEITQRFADTPSGPLAAAALKRTPP